MKSFFLSIFAGIAALFGVHSSTPAQQPVAPTSTIQNQASTTMSTTASTSLSTTSKKTTLVQDPTAPTITYPLGSENLLAGHSYTVTWKNQSPIQTKYSINLEFTSGGNYYVALALGIASSSAESIPFKIPRSMLPGRHYQIYLTNVATGHVLVGSPAFSIN